MRALVQQRVSRFGLLLAPIFGMFFLWRVGAALSGDDSPSQGFLPWQALTVTTFIGLWLVFRRGTYALVVIRFAEVTGLVIAGAAVILMAFAISYPARPDTILFFCLSYILTARAIMVPSTAPFTLLLGVLYGVPFVVSVFYIHLQHDPLIYTAAADPRLRLSAPNIAGRFTAVMGLWWVATTPCSKNSVKEGWGSSTEPSTRCSAARRPSSSSPPIASARTPWPASNAKYSSPPA